MLFVIANVHYKMRTKILIFFELHNLYSPYFAFCPII